MSELRVQRPGLIDPMLSLCISMHANPGLYSLLLGSGISRAAGIPTGWDIVQNLVRKLAAARGETCEPTPDAWYERIYGGRPEYSNILEEIGKTAPDRLGLLRGYFEPTEAERRQGVKTPTLAHRAIARLVRDGYVRVVLTTNFDRLLESALDEVGIHPVVITSPDTAAGALPIVHSPCTILKIHGDYLDTRIRNTRGELSSYDPVICRLLAQIFEEYGVVVCGWSAESDVALRDAIFRASGRRFTTYWTVRSLTSPIAADLISFRQAEIIRIDSADQFFADLAGKVASLKMIARPHPLSPAIAVEELKTYIRDDRADIRLHDLLVRETEAVVVAVWNDSYSADTAFTQTEFVSRVERYEAATEVLRHLLTAGGYWGNSSHEALWTKCFRSVALWHDVGRGNLAAWLDLKMYPALILLYSLGIGYVASEQYAVLDRLLRMELVYRFDRRRRTVAGALNSSNVMGHLGADGLQRWLPGQQTNYTPLSSHLFDRLRPQSRPYLPDDAAYIECFDWFEYLLGLTCFDITRGREERPSAPIGCFAWRHGEGSPDIYEQSRITEGQPVPPRVSKILDAGLFGTGTSRINRPYSELKEAFDAYARNHYAYMTI